MSLADRQLNPPAPVHGAPCSIGTLLGALEGPELAAFQEMLGSREWNASMIYDAVRDEGHTIGRQSINRHRAKRCLCFKGQR